MKVAIPSYDGDINGNIDSRFGRTNYFLIITLENNEIIDFEKIANPGAEEVRGAGFIAAETLANINPDILITSNLGPNSFDILSRTNIKIYQYSGNIHEALRLLSNNQLPELRNYTSPGKQNQEFGIGRGLGLGRGMGRGRGLGRGRGRRW